MVTKSTDFSPSNALAAMHIGLITQLHVTPLAHSPSFVRFIQWCVCLLVCLSLLVKHMMVWFFLCASVQHFDKD